MLRPLMTQEINPVAYAGVLSFKVQGNQTARYLPGLVVQPLQPGPLQLASVLSSSYSSGWTTVNLNGNGYVYINKGIRGVKYFTFKNRTQMTGTGILGQLLGLTSQGAVTYSSNTSLTSTTDGPMVLARYSQLTVNSGVTLNVSNRCQGLAILVDGLADIYGTISMSCLGANAVGAAQTFVINGGGSQVIASGVGAAGGGAVSGGGFANGNNGAAGTAGQTGGGGSGGAQAATSGAGAAGTSFSGGPGGGGADNGGTAQSGAANGGAGGAAETQNSNNVGGGAGNPGGAGLGGGNNGSPGTGGLLMLFCLNQLNLRSSSVLQACGAAGGTANQAGGGGSGGGLIWVGYLGSCTASAGYSLTAAGGAPGYSSAQPGLANGGAGGAGFTSINNLATMYS